MVTATGHKPCGAPSWGLSEREGGHRAQLNSRLSVYHRIRTERLSSIHGPSH